MKAIVENTINTLSLKFPNLTVALIVLVVTALVLGLLYVVYVKLGALAAIIGLFIFAALTARGKFDGNKLLEEDMRDGLL